MRVNRVSLILGVQLLRRLGYEDCYVMLTKERLIYTAGTFKIDEDLARARRLIIRSSVLRLPPTTNYQNERSNPPKYFLGYCTVFVNDYVYEIFPIEFEQQIILFWDNLEFQVFAKVVCESANISGNIARLGSAMTPPAILIPVPGIPGTFSGCPYTNLKFKLVFGARLLISASGEPMEFCEGIDIPSTVPNLNPPPAPYPPDQARDEDPPRSLPEEGELPGDTAPATIDDPEASSAVAGTWLLTWTQSNGSTASGSYAGLSTDTFALVSPGSVCTLSGSSDLVRNGSEIIEPSFNCNGFGFVSTLISAVFTAGASLRIASIQSNPGDADM